MKTTTLLLLPLTVLSALSPFCPVQAGALTTVVAASAVPREARTLASFQELALGMKATLVLRQGDEQRVEVEAAAEDLAQIETVVEQGRLRIRRPQKSGFRWNDDYQFRQPVKIYVTMPTVRLLSVSGSGTLLTETPIKAPQLKLSLSGSGRLQVNTVADELTTSVSGSGQIRVSGSAGSSAVSISGSGRLDAGELRTNATTARISGSGSCRVQATKQLDAHISGSGSVVYQGSPQVSSHIAGSGSVRRG